VRGTVFDWDGTLVDIDEREFYCINQALTEHGTSGISQEFYVQNYYQRPFEVGSGPRMVIETALEQDMGRADRVYESYKRLFASTVDRVRLHEGALQLLKLLNGEGLKVGIATMRFTRSVVASEIKVLGVDSWTNIFLTREDLGFDKRLGSLDETVDQRARLVTKVLAKLDVSIAESFLVGDSWWDVRAGKKLGMKTVLVKTGFSHYNDFSGENPDLLVGSLPELEARIRSGELDDS